LVDNKYDDNSTVHFTAGIIADLAGGIIWTPMELIKQRLQAQHSNAIDSKRNYTNPFNAFLQILKNDGFFGLYRY